MRNLLKTIRKQYFQDIANSVPKIKAQIILVTHILSDRPELLEALSSVAPIALIIAIPYSTNVVILQELQKNYRVKTPSLNELNNPEWLVNMVEENVNCNTPTIIIEIGGYFAATLKTLKKKLKNLIGIIEDTETGHRQYEALNNLPCPVISVARSTLKETEDVLVGNSCLFSTENLLRQAGFLMEGKHALVLGFGKVGRGLSLALLRRHCPVSVYDINPARRILALSENIHVPEKHYAFQHAEIIFGATGNFSINKKEDFALIKKGAILVSCSSKEVEFNLNFLNENYTKTEIIPYFDLYENKNHSFYLLGSGRPINFIDDGVIGPILALVQSEIIYAIKTLITTKNKTNILQVAELDRQLLAEKWLQFFCDQSTGYYRHA